MSQKKTGRGDEMTKGFIKTYDEAQECPEE
jgi:hypothetical protein